METMTKDRLQEIMDRLNQSTGSRSPSQSSKASNPYDLPPQTYEEFLAAEKINEWPQRITSENLLDLESEKLLLGDRNNILKELREATPVDMKFLQDLENQLSILEERLGHYASQIVSETPSTELEDGETLLQTVNRAFMTDLREQETVRFEAGSRKKGTFNLSETLREKKKKAVEYCTFPGFRAGELTELPGQLEAPQILNRVTKAQDFSPGFKKFWKKIFQSEASIAMMQDGFWWFFISNFEQKGKENAKNRLFDRIADSFVALFTSINPEVKDKFFTAYADCLAQSIFAAFHMAFPESEHHFQNDFKQRLCDTTSEWVSGIRAPPPSWRNWNIKRLEPKSLKTLEDGNGQTSQERLEAAVLNKNIDYKLDVEDFTRTVQQLGDPNEATPSTMSIPKQMSREQTQVTVTSQMGPPVPLSMSRLAQCGTPRREHVESHPMGPGPEMERIMFNLQGRSPLVAHYLHMRQLRENNNVGMKVRRTEIVKQPTEGQTYRQLINETKVKSDTLSKEYQRVCEQTSQEIQKIEKHERQMRRQIDKLQRDLALTKNVHEIKIMTERILDKREREANADRDGLLPGEADTLDDEDLTKED